MAGGRASRTPHSENDSGAVWNTAVKRQQIARSERALAGDLFRGGERLDQGLPAPGRARRVHQTRVLKIEEEPRDQAERVLALGNRPGQDHRGLDRCRTGNQPRRMRQAHPAQRHAFAVARERVDERDTGRHLKETRTRQRWIIKGGDELSQ